MLAQHISHYKSLCACQKALNNNADRWMYSNVVPPCQCRNGQTISVQTGKPITAQPTQTRKEKSFSKDTHLLHQLLLVLRREEDMDSIIMQGKRWVFLPRLNLGKRLNCSDEDIFKSLDTLHQEGYIETLNPSSEDVEEPPFFRVNRKKYDDLFGFSLKIHSSHQQ